MPTQYPFPEPFSPAQQNFYWIQIPNSLFYVTLGKFKLSPAPRKGPDKSTLNLLILFPFPWTGSKTQV